MLPGISTEEFRDLLLSVGTHHGKRRLSPLEVGQVLQKAITSGASLEDCAKALNFSGTSMVSRFLKLLKLNPDLHHLVDWGQTAVTVSFTSAWRIALLNEDEQEAACQEIITNQLRKAEVQQVLELRRHSQRSISDCIAYVLKMRPTIVKKYVFIGAVINERVREHLVGMKQADRDRLLKTVLEGLYGSTVGEAARLGTQRFTLATDETGAALLNEDGGQGFEADINTALESQIVGCI